MDDIEEIQKYMYVPIKVVSDGTEAVIMIYNLSEQNDMVINSKFEKERIKTYSICLLDINQSMIANSPVTYTAEVKDFSDLLRKSEKYEMSSKDIDAFGALLGAVSTKERELEEELQNNTNVKNAMAFSLKECHKQKSSILMLNGIKNKSLTFLKIETIDNSIDLTDKVSKETLEKVSEKISSFIAEKTEEEQSHLEQNKDKLKARLEYEILSIMPNTIKSDNINIDIDKILVEISEIRDMRDAEDADDDDDDDDGDDDLSTSY